QLMIFSLPEARKASRRVDSAPLAYLVAQLPVKVLLWLPRTARQRPRRVLQKTGHRSRCKVLERPCVLAALLAGRRALLYRLQALRIQDLDVEGGGRFYRPSFLLRCSNCR